MSHSPGVVDSEAIELSIGGLRIAARATGSGDPVLLLNGMSRPMESWAHFASALQDRTVIAFDAPGVGASQTPVVPHSMPMFADIAARVLDAFGIAKADVVGYSHGGAVAQQLAVGHPSRVNRLVLLATSCGVGSVPGRAHDVTRILLRPNDGYALGTTGSAGSALADCGDLNLVQHRRPPPHRDRHADRLRRWRQGRAAGEQQDTGGAHPRRPPCHDPGRTRSAKVRSRSGCGPTGRAVSRRAGPRWRANSPVRFSRRPAPHRCRIASAPTREPPLRGSARPDRRAR